MRIMKNLKNYKMKWENQLRFKTEQEFIEEFGEDWRYKRFGENGLPWPLPMDYLFGQPHDGSRKKDDWIISLDMLTDKLLPEIKVPKEKQEKPDAYIFSISEYYSRYNVLITAHIDNHKTRLQITPEQLTEFNILSESNYKAKHPDKLMFKEWEIEVTNTCIDIGCKTYTKETLRNFLFIIKEIEREAKETETEVNVQLYNIIQFLKKHKEELGL